MRLVWLLVTEMGWCPFTFSLVLWPVPEGFHRSLVTSTVTSAGANVYTMNNQGLAELLCCTVAAASTRRAQGARRFGRRCATLDSRASGLRVARCSAGKGARSMQARGAAEPEGPQAERPDSDSSGRAHTHP